MLSMLARYTESDVAVVGLVGERGREVKEFIEDNLGPVGMARTVVVVSTSDEPALPMRRQAAHLTLTPSEYFRDQGQEVLCMIDSITRFAMAQREIGLSAGEPPASKGYTPSVLRNRRSCWNASPGIGGSDHGAVHGAGGGWGSTNPSPTRCAASWTATSCWNARSRNGVAIRPSTS